MSQKTKGALKVGQVYISSYVVDDNVHACATASTEKRIKAEAVEKKHN